MIVIKGGIPLLVKKLQDIASFELIEQTIKLLEKLALDNHQQIIANNALVYMGQLLEFFDFSQQKNVLRLMNFLAKNVSARNDYESFVIPVIKLLPSTLRYNSDNKFKDVLELGSNLLSVICELLPIMYGTKSEDIAMLKTRVEEIAIEEIKRNTIDTLFVAVNSSNYSAITPQTLYNIMQILRFLCKYSEKICKELVSVGILHVIKGLLSTDTKLIANVNIDPTKNQGNEDVVGEGVVLLLDSILPYKSLLLDSKDNKDAKRTTKYLTEAAKEEILENQGAHIKVIWEAILPRIIK